MRRSLLSQLKKDFFEWCGLLSIEEVLSNPRLMEVAERVERMLLAGGA